MADSFDINNPENAAKFEPIYIPSNENISRNEVPSSAEQTSDENKTPRDLQDSTLDADDIASISNGRDLTNLAETMPIGTQENIVQAGDSIKATTIEDDFFNSNRNKS
jgi:hypothetical protein